jgi:hypothetical protein
MEKDIDRFYVDGFLQCCNYVYDCLELNMEQKKQMKAIQLWMVYSFHKEEVPREYEIEILEHYCNTHEGSYKTQILKILERRK